MSAAADAKNAASVALLTDTGVPGTLITLADAGKTIDPVTNGAKTSTQVSITRLLDETPLDETLLGICIEPDTEFDAGPLRVGDGCDLVLLESWSSSGSSGGRFSGEPLGLEGGVSIGGESTSKARGIIPDGPQMKWIKNPNKPSFTLQSEGIAAQPNKRYAMPFQHSSGTV